MKTVAVINQKGGVAKTTTAHAIGAALLREGARVLYVDTDAQGNLSYTLQAAAGAGVYEVLTGAAAPAVAVQRLGGGGAILASSPALSASDTAITATGKEYRLKEALETLAGDFDYCIIDTPPALGILTVNALTAAAGVVIPAQADIFSLQGIRQLAGTLEAVRKYCNAGLKVYGILLTRFNGRAIISREVAEVLNAAAGDLGARLFSTRIRECTAIKEAQAKREPLFSYAASSNGAADYLAFVEELKREMEVQA